MDVEKVVGEVILLSANVNKDDLIENLALLEKIDGDETENEIGALELGDNSPSEVDKPMHEIVAAAGEVRSDSFADNQGGALVKHVVKEISKNNVCCELPTAQPAGILTVADSCRAVASTSRRESPEDGDVGNLFSSYCFFDLPEDLDADLDSDMFDEHGSSAMWVFRTRARANEYLRQAKAIYADACDWAAQSFQDSERSIAEDRKRAMKALEADLRVAGERFRSEISKKRCLFNSQNAELRNRVLAGLQNARLDLTAECLLKRKAVDDDVADEVRDRCAQLESDLRARSEILSLREKTHEEIVRKFQLASAAADHAPRDRLQLELESVLGPLAGYARCTSDTRNAHCIMDVLPEISLPPHGETIYSKFASMHPMIDSQFRSYYVNNVGRAHGAYGAFYRVWLAAFSISPYWADFQSDPKRYINFASQQDSF